MNICQILVEDALPNIPTQFEERKKIPKIARTLTFCMNTTAKGTSSVQRDMSPKPGAFVALTSKFYQQSLLQHYMFFLK